ncbi:fumigaclavine B O-acetyltransferase easN [Aspergillus homomorphus CBS 101889]|uniref:O-acetyltransferase n=1 Tax=Aspergillus homomorphus (strain CBS 101889) TaxID=1450537 RepID=A0A395I2D3_ASPHC|nr:hypothetical protein BO97DRAFT_342020 [Aspergillus homomorphus CBS 101889]RAL13813.1 hypothetical protein BO97DRAFT_342020 [Aspergillus homomorphus CBS 101889]
MALQEISNSDPPLHVLSPLDHSIPKMYFTFFVSFSLQQPATGLESLRHGIKKLVDTIPFVAYDVVPCHDKLHENVHCIQPPSDATLSGPMLSVRDHSPASVTVLGDTATCTGDEEAKFAEKYASLPTILNSTQSKPALRFVANMMADGIILAVGFNHLVFDGTGVGNILGILSQCCRGAQNLTGLHELDLKLRQQLCLDGLAGRDAWKDFSASYSTESPFTCPPPGQWRTPKASPLIESFRFTVKYRKIRQLKTICSAILTNTSHTRDEMDASPPAYVSSHDVLTSILAVCLRQSQPSTFQKPDYRISFAANLRSRMSPRWPELYLGNMLAMLHVPDSCLADRTDKHRAIIAAHHIGMCSDDLIKITDTAAAIRHEIVSLTDSHIRGLIDHLRLQIDWGGMNIKGGDFSVTSLRHLKVYGFDFGGDLGAVADFRLHVGLLEGLLCVVLPRGRDGDWDIQFMLEKEQFHVLCKHRLFRWLMGERDGLGYCASPLHGTMD